MIKLNGKISRRGLSETFGVLLLVILSFSVFNLSKEVNYQKNSLIQTQMMVTDTSFQLESFLQVMSSEFEGEVMYIIEKDRRQREKIEIKEIENGK